MVKYEQRDMVIIMIQANNLPVKVLERWLKSYPDDEEIQNLIWEKIEGYMNTNKTT